MEAKDRYSDERVLPDGLTFMSLRRLWLRRMKGIMCDGDYFVMYPLFSF